MPGEDTQGSNVAEMFAVSGDLNMRCSTMYFILKAQKCYKCLGIGLSGRDQSLNPNQTFYNLFPFIITQIMWLNLSKLGRQTDAQLITSIHLTLKCPRSKSDPKSTVGMRGYILSSTMLRWA